MLWNAFVVIATGAVLLISVREGVRRALLNELDAALERDAEQILAFVAAQSETTASEIRAELLRLAVGHKEQSWFAEIYDTSGHVIWSTPNAPTQLEGGYETGEVSLVRRRLPSSVQDGSSLAVGASQGSVDRDVARIDQQVAIASAVVLLFAPIGGYLLAVRATEPVGQMIEVTESLRPEKLEERLPVRGTGDELDRLATTVNHLLDRINQYIKHGQEGLANAAHELRTPLAALRSTLEVALVDGESAGDREELIADVIQECDALETLVNQLLMIAETDVDRLGGTFESVRLDELVEKTAEFFQAVAEEHGLELTHETQGAVLISGNRHHLRQLLYNLVDNAVKFTALKYPPTEPDVGARKTENEGLLSDLKRLADGGRIDIELRADSVAQVARLTVRDDGIGIVPEHLPRLFERFYRGQHARERNVGSSGTGLGLSICKAIVHSHGGTIEVQSAPHELTEFIVTLPLAKGATHEQDGG